MAGLPVAGIGTVFYIVLLLGMGATKLWRWGLGSIRRIGQRRGGSVEHLDGQCLQPWTAKG